MGVDGLKLDGRLPVREGRARRIKKQGHIRVEIALVQADVKARQACVVGAGIFVEGIEHGALGGRRG